MNNNSKNIIVNARKHSVTSNQLTFNQVVGLAYGSVPNPEIYTVTFTRAFEDKQGSMSPGDVVKIKDGTIFSAMFTGNA